jgi:mRNA-degrading endonuclease YafQ of YafQ-DinJ toxin-antitoxin module
MLFEIQIQTYATKKARKLVKKNIKLEVKIASCLVKLKNNPFDISLGTHKVNSKKFGLKYSSIITGDLRFIWDFDTESLKVQIIEIFDIGGHSGTDGVY